MSYPLANKISNKMSAASNGRTFSQDDNFHLELYTIINDEIMNMLDMPESNAYMAILTNYVTGAQIPVNGNVVLTFSNNQILYNRLANNRPMAEGVDWFVQFFGYVNDVLLGNSIDGGGYVLGPPILYFDSGIFETYARVCYSQVVSSEINTPIDFWSIVEDNIKSALNTCVLQNILTVTGAEGTGPVVYLDLRW